MTVSPFQVLQLLHQAPPPHPHSFQTSHQQAIPQQCSYRGGVVGNSDTLMYHVIGPSNSPVEPFWVIAVIAQNGSNSRLEGPVTQCVVAPAIHTMRAHVATLLPPSLSIPICWKTQCESQCQVGRMECWGHPMSSIAKWQLGPQFFQHNSNLPFSHAFC